MLTSAFGASIAASIATAYGCAGISSGRMSTGVWQLRTKSRVTVKTKSALVRYILVRNLSTISIVISGRRLISSGPHPFIFVSQKRSRISGRDPLGCAGTAQQREAGGGLFIVDANGASYVGGHRRSSLPSLLRKYAWRCGHRRRCGTRFQ